MPLSDAERYLRQWHARHPDGTRVFATLHDSAGRTSYDRLAARFDAAQSVLDVACGAGTLLARIAVRAPRRLLAGVDLSATDLALAQSALPSGRFAVARAQALPLSTASMDAVACHLALMLMDDPIAVLSEMRRVLRPGGTLDVVVVNPTGFDPDTGRVVRSLLSASDPRDATRPPRIGDPRTFTPEGLRLLLANGFTDVAIEEVIVTRDVLRSDLWSFLSESVYGLDHLSDDVARAQLEELELPPKMAWKIPLYFASATACADY